MSFETITCVECDREFVGEGHVERDYFPGTPDLARVEWVADDETCPACNLAVHLRGDGAPCEEAGCREFGQTVYHAGADCPETFCTQHAAESAEAARGG